jgi:hypothetical protein
LSTKIVNSRKTPQELLMEWNFFVSFFSARYI